ncbi:hypothetical protein BT96DRAFT_1013226 [Gymnopus androsaceus JB14]|uniref:Uncharacterized protein n=1 Tax=Gymnopus androsaceus JB14 TaxID=1447944 RepID=A0A6A4IDA7_9AGAR|nr:hypothetical protein BT96DRAFT_1013226 [Gymnopus androsaceus JB14]
MPRGNGKSVGFDLDDNFSFMQASQASNGSDDTAIELAVAEKYIASRDKKKKEQQKKFLVSGRKFVSKETDGCTETLQTTAQSVEELLQAFTINYAAEDDCIRALWSAIHEEQRKLHKLSKHLTSASVNAGVESEASLIKGMGKAKEAVLETQKVIDFIYPKKEL